MQDQPRTLRAMLTSSKETAGLMVDLAYGAVYFDDLDMAREVDRLWEELIELAHQMRVVAILAARTRREAEDMASVVQVIGAIEDLGRDAVDIARIASQGVGLPAGLVNALSDSGSLLSRVVISEGSLLDGATLAAFRLPLETGSRVIALRRGGLWNTAVEGSTVLQANDVAVLIGPRLGLTRVRELAGVSATTASVRTDTVTAPDLGAAVDLLGEMKTLSEVAIGLAYAVLLTGDAGLADEVSTLAERLDQLKDEMQTWVLQAAGDASGLASLLLLSQAAEDLGDRAADMVRHVTRQERIHPVLAIALGESDEVAEQVTIATGSLADGANLRQVTAGTGFVVLALRRDGRYQFRPASDIGIHAGDDLIATGPREGRALLSARCSQSLD